MKIKIGAYDRATRTVPVTFTSGDIVHERTVNACVGTDGSYDRAATAARVADVGRGVAHKIEVGAITATIEREPVSEPTDTGEPAAA